MGFSWKDLEFIKQETSLPVLTGPHIQMILY